MEGEEEEIVGPFHRISARTRRMATRMASALASSDNRTQTQRIAKEMWTLKVYFDGPIGQCP
uniref:Uncharacterized protein n=1 Tax=Oryza nivara TaxID=4536 RepID=A0A0E0GMS2_ORYNI